MKVTLLTIVMLLVLSGCEDPLPGWKIVTSPGRPIEVKVVNDSGQEARIRDLEARVLTLENWAAKNGRRY